MPTTIHLKFVASLLLLVTLAVTLQGALESAHAMPSPVTATSPEVGNPAPDDTPCTPFEHHQDYDGCDSCVKCACHASLTVQPFQLSYNPLVSELQTAGPFSFLPEVYLSKFIPPQILA